MRRFFKKLFVVLIILGAGLLAEFLYFGLLGSKKDSYQAANTIFILNGASERIKEGYEPGVGSRWSEDRSRMSVVRSQTSEIIDRGVGPSRMLLY